MADKQTLANFVDGAFVPPAEGGYTDVVNAATRVIAHEVVRDDLVAALAEQAGGVELARIKHVMSYVGG